jgi:hypothetical protein
MWRNESTVQTWVRVGNVYIPLDNIAAMEIQPDTRAGRGGQWQIFFRFKQGGGTSADGLASAEACHELVTKTLGTQMPVSA